MIKIAISGNIASGKSQVENYLTKLGYIVYDTDSIAHEILDNMTEFYDLDVFTDGKIDRKKLGEIIFSNTNYKKKLEKIVHPQIRKKLKNIFDLYKTEKIIFISVPLLFEAKFEKLFDKIIFISVDPKIQLKRLMKRNNYTEEQALMRINSQLPQNLKIKKSDYVLQNNSSIKNLHAGIDNIIEQLKIN